MPLRITHDTPKSYSQEAAQSAFERILFSIDEAKAAIIQDIEASRREGAESYTDPAIAPLVILQNLTVRILTHLQAIKSHCSL